jgi:cytosine/adenosine deaminase-related metal-dependent hydrolase
VGQASTTTAGPPRLQWWAGARKLACPTLHSARDDYAEKWRLWQLQFMSTGRSAFRARYVFPVAAPPLPEGVVTVENGRIVGVGRQPFGCPVTDLGNSALVPGLFNAHTHLELSGLAQPLGTPGIAFTDWVRLVVAYRRSLPRYAHDVAAGRDECLRHGQVVVGDIATLPWVEIPGEPTLTGTVFHETLGLRRELTADRLAAAKSYLAHVGDVGRPSQAVLAEPQRASKPAPRRKPAAASSEHSPQWRRGLGPHAPYSVHPELFDGLVGLAASAGAPVAFHLAETREELELLQSGGGPFRQLLIELGAWDGTAIPLGTRPIDYLRRLAASGVRSLVIHGNYLDEAEMALLAAHAERMTLVYCPRTHAFFGHTRHPLPRLLESGANVAVGTDSRASNPDLNLMEELRYVARTFPEIPSNGVLELATLRAARALGLEKLLGTIEIGKFAALTVVPLADAEVSDPHWLLFESDRSAAPLIAEPNVLRWWDRSPT